MGYHGTIRAMRNEKGARKVIMIAGKYCDGRILTGACWKDCDHCGLPGCRNDRLRELGVSEEVLRKLN